MTQKEINNEPRDALEAYVELHTNASPIEQVRLANLTQEYYSLKKALKTYESVPPWVALVWDSAKLFAMAILTSGFVMRSRFTPGALVSSAPSDAGAVLEKILALFAKGRKIGHRRNINTTQEQIEEDLANAVKQNAATASRNTSREGATYEGATRGISYGRRKL
jgi:hypothetical protein